MKYFTLVNLHLGYQVPHSTLIELDPESEKTKQLLSEGKIKIAETDTETKPKPETKPSEK